MRYTLISNPYTYALNLKACLHVNKQWNSIAGMIYYPEVISDIFKRGILSPWKMLRCFLRALSNTTFMSGLTRVLRDPETSLSFTALDLQRPYFTFVDQLIDLLSTGREHEKIVATRNIIRLHGVTSICLRGGILVSVDLAYITTRSLYSDEHLNYVASIEPTVVALPDLQIRYGRAFDRKRGIVFQIERRSLFQLPFI